MNKDNIIDEMLDELSTLREQITAQKRKLAAFASGYQRLVCEKGEGRVMLLKGYGNAIVPELAAEFIAAFEEAR